MRVRAILVAGAVLASAAVLGPVQAQAATSVTLQPRSISAPVPSETVPQNVVPLNSVSLSMAAGQTAYVVAVMRANAATQTSLLDNEVICKLPDGTSKNMVIGQNVYKSGAGHPTWEDVTLTTRYLVQTPVAGTVTCTAQIRAVSLAPVGGTYQFVGGTLEFADASIDNATDGTAIQTSVPNGNTEVSAANPTVRLPSIPMFTLASGFKGLSVFGDTEYMVCLPNKTCAKGDSTARFTLFVNQWKADGTLCQSIATPPVTKTMNYYVHHHFVPLNLPNFTIRTDSGCAPQFNAYVKIDYVSGDLGAVQGVAVGLYDSNTSTTKHNSDMSHAFVVPYH